MPRDRALLADDEEVLVDTRLHWIPLAGPGLLVLAALGGAIAIAVVFPGAPVAVTWVLAAMVGIPALWLAGRFLRWRGIRLVVTTSRIVYRRGVLGRDVAQLRLQRLAEVHCAQTLRQRLIGCGRLVLEVDGGEAMVVEDVRRPRTLQRVIAGQLDESWYGAEAEDHWRSPPRPVGPSRPTRSVDHDSSTWGAPAPRAPAMPVAGVPAAVPAEPVTVPTPLAITETPPHGTPAAPHTIVLPTVPAVPPAASAPPVPPAPAAPPLPAPNPAVSIPEQLIALDELRRRGILTAEEFQAKKAELLRRL